jgi:hypothetical protein
VLCLNATFLELAWTVLLQLIRTTSNDMQVQPVYGTFFLGGVGLNYILFVCSRVIF